MNDKVKQLPVAHRSREQAIELVHYDPKQHCNHIFVSYRIRDGEADVECGGCGTRLDPMFVLKQLARQDSLYSRRQEAAVQTAKELEKRKRTTCDHCGKMTRIRGL